MNLYQEEEHGPDGSPVPGPVRYRPEWFIVACLGSSALVLAIIFWVGGQVKPILPGNDRNLFHAEGRDTAECEGEIVAPANWELRWEHDGELQQICWTNEYGVTECYSAMPRKPIRHEGSVNIVHGGRFKLRVYGTGNWKMDAYTLSSVP